MEQTPDPRPGRYYVSVLNGGRSALLAGPWPRHEQALAQVEAVRAFACEVDPRGHWYAFGTARLPEDSPAVPGKLNSGLTFTHLWTGRGTLCSLDNSVDQKPNHVEDRAAVTCPYCLTQLEMKNA